MKALVTANLGEVVPSRSSIRSSSPAEQNTNGATVGLFRRILEAALSCGSVEAMTCAVSFMFVAAM
jgi:hypothetical protein